MYAIINNTSNSSWIYRDNTNDCMWVLNAVIYNFISYYSIYQPSFELVPSFVFPIKKHIYLIEASIYAILYLFYMILIQLLQYTWFNIRFSNIYIIIIINYTFISHDIQYIFDFWIHSHLSQNISLLFKSLFSKWLVFFWFLFPVIHYSSIQVGSHYTNIFWLHQLVSWYCFHVLYNIRSPVHTIMTELIQNFCKMTRFSYLHLGLLYRHHIISLFIYSLISF